MRRASRAIILCAMVNAWVQARAEARGAADSAALSIPRISAPLRLEEFLGTNAAARAGRLAHVTGFVQRAPADGEPATEQTDVFLARDESRLYVVFVASDREPAK